jgi:predicted transcriptional regulator
MDNIENIKIRRRKLGITQVGLASEASVSQSLLAKLESGKINPSYSTVVAIDEALDRLEQREKPSAFSIANKKIISLASRDKIEKAIHIMRRRGISQIPVIDRGRVVGSVSEHLLISHPDHSKKSFHNKKIGEIMEDSFPILPKSASVDTVSDILKYSSAVLLSEKGKIVGVITKTDLLGMI